MRVPNDDDVVVFQRGSHPVITKTVLYSWVTAYIFVIRHPYSATAQQVFELREEGGGGGGIREGIFFRARRGHACGFLFKFSKVTENAIMTIKLRIFSTSSVMLLSGLRLFIITKLKYHRLLCYTTDINL